MLMDVVEIAGVVVPPLHAVTDSARTTPNGTREPIVETMLTGKTHCRPSTEPVLSEVEGLRVTMRAQGDNALVRGE